MIERDGCWRGSGRKSVGWITLGWELSLVDLGQEVTGDSTA